MRKTSFWLSLVATAGVVFFGVLQGILIAVALSVVLFFRRSWWPHGEVLGHDDVRGGWHSVRTSPDATVRPDVLVFRWEAPLFFANAGMFRQQIRHLVRTQRTPWLVLQCEAMTDIDVTAADMLERLDTELNKVGVHVCFVEMRSRLQDLVLHYGLLNTLDGDHFYDSIEEALAAIDSGEAERDSHN